MRNIYLIGPMGVGKTTVGRILSETIGYKFYDLDQELENCTGASVSWIFEKEGESGFRVREQKMTEKLCQKKQVILATGGGVVLLPENREILSKSGFVVYMTASIDTLIKRTMKDKNRPLLQCDNPRAVLEKILSQRNDFYVSIADVTIVSNDNSAYEMASKIIDIFEKENFDKTDENITSYNTYK